MPWDRAELYTTPKFWPAEGFTNEGIKAYFFEGPPYKGKRTKVFAWYGAPAGMKKVPAMVVVHGGGGTAFAEWVKLWNDRGYAAIAVDTCGATPSGFTEASKRVRHEAAGPDGWGGFTQVDDDLKDQWTYHAVAAVVRAHSLLRSFPEVDKDRVGLTGISWGGYLTSVVSGVDERFKCAIPVYGCGFFDDDSAWSGTLKGMGEKGEFWLSHWDASQFLPAAKLPMLWVNGTIDHFFPMPSWQKSYRLPTGPRNLSLRVNMSHSHGAGWTPPEIFAFTESLFNGKTKLPEVTASGSDKNQAWASYRSETPIVEAELNYSSDVGPWEFRYWVSSGASIDASGKKVSAEIPQEATVYYFNIYDSRGMLVSSEHVERQPTAQVASKRRVLIDESYDGRSVGRVPIGAVGVYLDKGASIHVSDEASLSGKNALKFQDAPGLAKAWEPFREFNFRGKQTLTNGTVTLSFAIMNSATKPSDLTVEARDYSEKQYQAGPSIEFLPDGKLKAGGNEVAALVPGKWVRIKIVFRPAAVEKKFTLEVSPVEGKTQAFEIPYSKKFNGLHWLGFVTGNAGEAVMYIDDLRLMQDAD